MHLGRHVVLSEAACVGLYLFSCLDSALIKVWRGRGLSSDV